jgi:integrase
MLIVRQSKTGAELQIEIEEPLRAIIDATPSEHLTFLVTKTSKSYSANDFSDQFRVWCDEAGLPGRCSAHGLRKKAGTDMADAQCTTHEIAAKLGHKSLKMVAHYTAKYDQARLVRSGSAKMAAARTKRDGKLTNS